MTATFSPVAFPGTIRTRFLIAVAFALVGLAACGGGGTTDPGPTVTSVQVTSPFDDLLVGDSIQLTATVLGENAVVLDDETVQWNSEASGVASVTQTGSVDALSAGSARITATAGGRSGGVTLNVYPLGETFSQSIGPTGGTIETPLPGGLSLELRVPANAVTGATVFGLQAQTTPPGALARFNLTPAGAALNEPAELVFTLPEAIPSGEMATLTSLNDGVSLFHPLETEDAGRRLVGRISTFGSEVAAGTAPRGGTGDTEASAAHRQSPSGEVLEMILANLAVVEIKDSARVALTRAQQNPTFQTVERVNSVMKVLALAQVHPSFQPDGNQLLASWRIFLCGQLDQATAHFNGLAFAPPFGFSQFFDEVDVLVAWWALAKVLDDSNEEFNFPFEGCTTNVTETLRTKSDAFVTIFIAELGVLQQGDLVIRFNDFMITHIPRALQLKGRLQQIGFEEFAPDLDEAIGRVLVVLRPVAWSECRLRNDHTYLARLMTVEVSGGGQFSPFDTDDLADDVEQCGTDLLYFVRDSTGATTASGHLGGTGAGAADRLANLTIPVGGRLVIKGDLRWITCPSSPPFDNGEVVRVVGTVLPESEELLSRSVPSTGPRNYLRADSLVFTAAGVRRSLALTSDASGKATLRLQRVGLTCDGVYNSLPDPATLAEIELTTDLLYSNDFNGTVGSEWSTPTISVSPSGQPFLGQMTSQGNTLTLVNMPDHTNLILEFDLILIDSWNGNGGQGTASPPDLMTFQVAGGAVLKRTTFSNKPEDEQAFPGDHPGGVNPAGTGAVAINSLGFPPDDDAFGDSLYRISLPFSHSSLSIGLQFGAQQTSGQNERWGLDNVRVLKGP